MVKAKSKQKNTVSTNNEFLQLAFISKNTGAAWFWAGYYREQNAGGRWNEHWKATTTNNAGRRVEFLHNNWSDTEPNNAGAKKQECVSWNGIWDKWENVQERNGLFDDYWCDRMGNVICEAVNEYRPNYTQKSDRCTTNYGELKSHYIIYSSRSNSFSDAVSFEDSAPDHIIDDILNSYNVRFLV